MKIESQAELIRRAAVEILPSEQELAAKIRVSVEKKQPLVVKAGFDPTAPDIHLGHTVLLRKLRHFQESGHRVIFLIGDYTAMIGDPSGVSKTRPVLTKEEVAQNAKTYKKQISKVLDLDKLEIRFNSEWLGKMDGAAIMRLMSGYSAIRMLERDDFANRFKHHKPIRMVEFLYPLLQAYDSVALRADVEIGGTDQKFNMLIGRDIQEYYGQKPQAVITMPILTGLDGAQKMSKSLDNYIGINEPPEDMFGKLMSIPDEMMPGYYELLTDEAFDAGIHPKKAKERLAWTITSQYHGRGHADAALASFNKKHVTRSARDSKEGFLDVAQTKYVEWPGAAAALADIILLVGCAKSKNEARRLIEQGAVRVNHNVVKKLNFELSKGEILLQVGKRQYVKVVPK